MFINTHSEISMKKSVCELFGISIRNLSELLKMISVKASKDCYFDGDIFNEIVDNFIKSHLSTKKINQVLFFHLSRRLNSANNTFLGNNLFDLLTTENVFSDFLKKHSVRFSPCNNHIEMYYNGDLVTLENTYESNVCYLRSRLGYNKGREDFCFNGFAFKDLLYRNSYSRELSDVPEFIGVLATFLKCKNIGTDYYLNSRYYCFEYCIPMERVFFDNDDKMSLECKMVYILNQVIQRLYDYSVTDLKYMYDHENPVLRLSDSDTMLEKYFVTREEITSDMLK